MLTELRLRDFKSFADVTVPFAPLTVLVGANASGKSNLLDAIRFLQGVYRGLTIAEVLHGRSEGGIKVWSGVRGDIAGAIRLGQGALTLESRWERRSEEATREVPYPRPLRHKIRCGHAPPGNGIQVFGESFTGDPPWTQWIETGSYLDEETSGTELRARIRDGDELVVSKVSSQRSLAQTPVASLRSKEEMAWLPAMFAFTTVLRPNFESMEPSVEHMREYASLGATLGSQGENVSAVLESLCSDVGKKRDLVGWLSAFCAPTVVDLDFIKVPETGDVMLQLVEEGGAKIAARSLSDGTLRLLALLATLMTIEEGAILTLEEPDVGLHPTRIHLLAELLQDFARRRSIQVIATTHSPTLVGHLSDDALADVVAFGRDEENHTSIARRLGDLEHFAALRDGRDVAHLFATGWVEQAL